MAFALGLDPLFVGVHYLARFFLISLALPLVAKRINQSFEKGTPQVNRSL
jgi:uncharacterized protein